MLLTIARRALYRYRPALTVPSSWMGPPGLVGNACWGWFPMKRGKRCRLNKALKQHVQQPSANGAREGHTGSVSRKHLHMRDCLHHRIAHAPQQFMPVACKTREKVHPGLSTCQQFGRKHVQNREGNSPYVARPTSRLYKCSNMPMVSMGRGIGDRHGKAVGNARSEYLLSWGLGTPRWTELDTNWVLAKAAVITVTPTFVLHFYRQHPGKHSVHGDIFWDNICRAF